MSTDKPLPDNAKVNNIKRLCKSYFLVLPLHIIFAYHKSSLCMKRILFAFSVFAGLTASAWDTPTMGWSSWNTYRNQISDEIIMKQADALVSTGLAEAGYRYVNIDDGAFGGRDASGRLVVHPTRFPNGLKPVVEHIRSLGLKAGTYSDAGRNTCASFWDHDTSGRGTGLYGHDRTDIAWLFGELGFEFIKVDFCGGDPAQNSEHLDLDEKERYTAIADAIKATGVSGARLNVCRWAFPGTWVSDIAGSWRISPDISPRWESVKSIIERNLYLSAYAGEGHFNDMDMLEVGRGMRLEEDRTHFGMWCMLASPLLIGCDISKIDEETLALLSNPELIALNQDPLALQAHVVSRKGRAYVLVKDLETLGGTVRALAFYNSGDGRAEMSVDFADLGLGGDVKVRDLYERTDVGTFSDSFSETVRAHGTRIYRLEAERRLERRVYEAEAARIGAYQELENNQTAGTGTYEEDSACSGGAKAVWLGGSVDNDLQWRDVWSNEGGEYTMALVCASPEARLMHVEVNGEQVAELTCPASSEMSRLNLDVSLAPGFNTVRLWASDNRMPDIDCMELTSKSDGASVVTVSSESERPTQIYTLGGIPVNEPSASGIYVSAGRKIAK